ncbi:MAG: hypothetical protein H8K03_21535 [Nitrospira sp.]
MVEAPNTRPTVEPFKGHQILLTPRRNDDGTWDCEYVILEFLITASPSSRGYTKDRFGSPTEARAAALLAAITAIESRLNAGDLTGPAPPLGLTTVTDSNYNGRVIRLRSGQQPDGTWICQYTIRQLGPARTASLIGYPKGSFSSRDAAQAAALEVAQGEIDADVPQSSIN